MTTGHPYFSIITASLNSEKHIRDNIESIKAQSFRDIEHIVIDGGSTDGTTGVLLEYEKTYPLRWISEPDKGISDALNKGLSIAKGHYIIIIQADDTLIDSDILMSVFSLLHKSNKEIYCFPVVLDHTRLGKVLKKPIRQLWYNRFKFIFPHQGCFISRDLHENVGNYSTALNIAMDYDFFYRALKSGRKIGFGNFPVAIMGGDGIGTDDAFTHKRLQEERRVQKLNEDQIFWRIAQQLFRMFYLPYRALKYRH